MNRELAWIATQLAQAQTPADVFGDLGGQTAEQMANLKKIYHQIAKITHPDVYQDREDKSLAEIAFDNLAKWYARAEELIRAGNPRREMGSRDKKTILLRTPNRAYTVEAGYEEGQVYNLYPCYFEENGQITQASLKIVRDPQHNDLAQNEARLIRILQGGLEAQKYSAYIPRLVESFIYQEIGIQRQALVFARYPGWYSLVDVHKAYPYGIDPKDMAWMWRRLLVALGFAHLNRIIHGAILPKNIWIHPEQHGLLVCNWLYAAYDPPTTGEQIAALDLEYLAWYPQEILNREDPLPGTDIFMSAKCMLYLLGGDPASLNLPRSTPALLKAFLKGCLLPGKRSHPQDAWGLKEEFDELLKRIWGERQFHPFYMRNP